MQFVKPDNASLFISTLGLFCPTTCIVFGHYRWATPNNSGRWRSIKQIFSIAMPKTERRSKVRLARGERGIWQRRFWERMILDDADYAAHIDYCYINPVKHGLVRQAADWPYSTFHRYVKRGIIPMGWATSSALDKVDGERP